MAAQLAISGVMTLPLVVGCYTDQGIHQLRGAQIMPWFITQRATYKVGGKRKARITPVFSQEQRPAHQDFMPAGDFYASTNSPIGRNEKCGEHHAS